MMIKTNKLFKATTATLCLALGLNLVSCNDDNEVKEVAATKYLVSASVEESGYFTTTDNITSGKISIIGKGYEGFANLGASVDGYFYTFGDGTLDKYRFTSEGLAKIESISTEALNPGSFYRYIIETGTGDLFLSTFPNDDGKSPYAIIDLAEFTVEKHGFLEFPKIGVDAALWTQPVVSGDKIYFGTMYGIPKKRLNESLNTVKFDYPAMTNAEVISTNVSAGSTGGYRTNASFVTENGDIYQHNLQSVYWTQSPIIAKKPTVITRIKDGKYDDSYLYNISAEYDEPVSIWNAWYAGNDILYANIVKDGDISKWGDLSLNNGKLVEINLKTKKLIELNIPKAPYVNLFKAECIENGKFYIPVSISGGDANIYEITIGGGANGFKKGAALDGSNVYINGLYRNF